MAPPDEPTICIPSDPDGLALEKRWEKLGEKFQVDPAGEPLTPLQVLEAIERELTTAVRRTAAAREILLRHPDTFVHRTGFALVDQVRDLEHARVEVRSQRLALLAYSESSVRHG